VKWSPSTDQDRNKVGLKLVGQLKRELTYIKRAHQDGSHQEDNTPLGIIGYLRSLIESCKSSKLLLPDIAERELSWINGVSQSFDAQLQKMKNSEEAKRNRWQASKQLTGVIVTVVSLAFLVWINLNQATVNNVVDVHPGGLPEILKPFTDGSQHFSLLLLSMIACAFGVSWVLNYGSQLQANNRLRLRRLKKTNWLQLIASDTVLVLFLLILFIVSLNWKLNPTL
jgi:hypothetical protein